MNRAVEDFPALVCIYLPEFNT